MNRNEFFNTLFANLPQYTKEEQDEIRTYYDELISDGIEAGLDEAEVISKLDTPENIAHSLNAEYGKIVNVAKIQSSDAVTDLLEKQPGNINHIFSDKQSSSDYTSTQPIHNVVLSARNRGFSVGVSEDEQVIDAPIEVNGQTYRFTAVSMGNPHAIVYMDDVDGLDIEKIGPSFESHVNFPDRVNTEFVRVIDRHTVQMRVWERGSGETLACGTGACAVAVSSILNGLVDRNQPVTVKLLGGDLNIFWDESDDQVYMTGPATTVFDGEIDLGFLGE